MKQKNGSTYCGERENQDDDGMTMDSVDECVRLPHGIVVKSEAKQ